MPGNIYIYIICLVYKYIYIYMCHSLSQHLRKTFATH